LAKTKWRKLSHEKKSHFHMLSRVRTARHQVEAWLKSQRVEVVSDRKKNFRKFLEMLGVYRHGLSINKQIEAMYLDIENDLITKPEAGFYLSMDWISLRYQVIEKYGKVCMRCNSTCCIAVDHIKPRSLFPELSLDFDNMQVLCRSCNSKKSNRDTTDYRIKGVGINGISEQANIKCLVLRLSV